MLGRRRIDDLQLHNLRANSKISRKTENNYLTQFLYRI
jgi:hypothetical protein